MMELFALVLLLLLAAVLMVRRLLHRRVDWAASRAAYYRVLYGPRDTPTHEKDT